LDNAMKTFMRRRLHPVELAFHLAPFIVLALIAATGCTNLKSIPLFNPDATLKNRIGSAYEVYGEVNGQIAEFVAKGWMTQDEVNRSWSPSLDNTRKMIDAADELRKIGDTAGSNAKLDSVKAILKTLRDGLASIQRSKAT
jgi:hypothetical protein